MLLVPHQQVRFIARIAPATLTLLVLLLGIIPSYSLGDGSITPTLALLLIFYWSVYWPEALPYYFLFVIGIVQDAFHSGPMGLSPILFMGIAYLVQSQRRHMGKAVFLTVWFSFALLSGMATLVEWSITCLYKSHSYGLKLPAARWMLTVAAYPLLHLLLTQCYKRLRIRQ